MSLDADSVTGIRHEALFYAGADELLTGVLAFVEAGMRRGDAVFVVVPHPARRALEAELGDGERIRFAAIEEGGRNPARIIPAWRDFVAAARVDGVAARGVVEASWGGRSAVALEECERHEALLNLAFAEARGWSMLCPYDVAALDDRVLDAAARNHPLLREGRPSSSAATASGSPTMPATWSRSAPAGTAASSACGSAARRARPAASGRRGPRSRASRC